MPRAKGASSVYPTLVFRTSFLPRIVFPIATFWLVGMVFFGYRNGMEDLIIQMLLIFSGVCGVGMWISWWRRVVIDEASIEIYGLAPLKLKLNFSDLGSFKFQMNRGPKGMILDHFQIYNRAGEVVASFGDMQNIEKLYQILRVRLPERS